MRIGGLPFRETKFSMFLLMKPWHHSDMGEIKMCTKLEQKKHWGVPHL